MGGGHSSKQVLTEAKGNIDDGYPSEEIDIIFKYFANDEKVAHLTMKQAGKFFRKVLKYNSSDFTTEDMQKWYDRLIENGVLPRTNLSIDAAIRHKQQQANQKDFAEMQAEQEFDNTRFLLPSNRGFEGLSYATQGKWRENYTFVQLADPQLGFLSAMLTQNVPRKWLNPTHVLFSGDVKDAEEAVGRKSMPEGNPNNPLIII